MISRSFVKSSFIYSIFGALPLASSIILLPFYTNLLSNHDFGILAIFISFTLLIQVMVNFSFDAMAGINYYDYKENNSLLKEYIGTISTTLILIGACFCIFAYFAGPPLFQIIFQNKIDFFPYGLMSVITAVFNSFFKTYTYLLINQQRPERFLWMNLFNFFLTIIISITGLYIYPHELTGPMYGRLLSGAGIFLLTLFFFQTEYGLNMKSKLLKGALLFCIPLVSYNIMSWVISYIDRFIINDFNDPTTVGIYDFGVKCTLLIDFVFAGLASATNPKMFSIWQSKKINHSTKEVNKYHHSLSALNMIMIAATIFFIPLIVPLVVTNKNYYQAFQFLPILSVSFITRALLNMYSAPVYFFKKTYILPKVFFLTAIIQLAATFFMVKYFGLWGAVWSLLLIKPIQIVLMGWESSKIFHYSYNKTKMIFLPLLFSAILIFDQHYLKTPANNLAVSACEMIFTSAIIFFIYRKEIRELISQLLRKRIASKIT